MFELMKIIHMLALLGGGAAMIGNGLLLKKVMNSDGPPPEMVSTTMRTLGMVGLASIVLLWITGLVMMSQTLYPMDWQYILKLIGAALVLGAVSMMSMASARAAKAGTPPDLKRLKTLASVSRGGVLIAIIFAVTVFN